MRRRDVLVLFGGAATLGPSRLSAQPSGKTFRLGVFAGSPDNPIMGPAYRAFLEELQKLGYAHGQNLAVEFRSTTVEDATTLAAQARELVRLKVDVLVALGGETALKGVAAASHTIPIVFVANNYDPIALGYVGSLAKPGGNVTGIFLRQTELAEKQIELLVEAVPDRKRVAVLWDAISADQFTAAEKRARALGLQIQSLKMEKPPYDLDAAFRMMKEAGSQMLLALTSQFFGQQSQRLIELATRDGCLPCLFLNHGPQPAG
jgi:putative ABC transport system substrate-binding protein